MNLAKMDGGAQPRDLLFLSGSNTHFIYLFIYYFILLATVASIYFFLGISTYYLIGHLVTIYLKRK